jgi:hypothetical protein
MIKKLQTLVDEHGFDYVLNVLMSLRHQDDEISVETIISTARAIAVMNGDPGATPTRLNYVQAVMTSTGWAAAKSLDWVRGHVQF